MTTTASAFGACGAMRRKCTALPALEVTVAPTCRHGPGDGCERGAEHVRRFSALRAGLDQALLGLGLGEPPEPEPDQHAEHD